MEERDYAMFVYGEYAEYAFNEYGREMLEERFLGNFGDSDWYGGITNYLNGCEEFLAKAEADDPVRPSYWPRIAMMTALSCLAAGFVCYILLRGMKTVRPGAKADAL